MIKNPEIVVSHEALSGLAVRLGGEPVLAFDLEADSLHHYQEKVCLIQVSSVLETALIDPLALPDLSPLSSVMADPSIRKVFHGADYDIRCLHREFGIEVNNLFDTMIACQFLGYKELGLAAVLKGRFGLELDKRYQKADWSRRPLPPEMIEYAVKDTCLLIEFSRQLEEELAAKGRLSWAVEEFELLSRVRAASRENEPLFLRFKGAAAMAPRTLAVLEELLRFRDETARRRDLPPFKVMGPDTIRELAEKRPMKPDDLKDIVSLTPKLAGRYGSSIIDAVTKAMAFSDSELPHYPVIRRKRPDRSREETLKKLKVWRDAKGGELKVDPWIVATNNLLEELAEKVPSGIHGMEEITAMKGWQRREFGAELLGILSSARGGRR
jgi:ribonuclease D